MHFVRGFIRELEVLYYYWYSAGAFNGLSGRAWCHARS